MNPLLRNGSAAIAFDQIQQDHVEAAMSHVMAHVGDVRKKILASAPDDASGRLYQRDVLFDDLDAVLSPLYLLKETHPDAGIREACQRAVEQLFNFYNQLMLDEELYTSLKEFSEADVAMDPVARRYLKKTMDFFMRNGFQLNAEDRQTLQQLDEQLNQKELLFQKNIADCDDVEIFNETEMDGLPEDFKKSHLQDDGSYRITMKAPDYTMVLKLATNSDVRRRLFTTYLNRVYDTNLALLDEIIKLRVDRAKLLGFNTYADYRLVDVMAKKTENVWNFIHELSQKIKAKADADYRILDELKTSSPLQPWDKTVRQ